MKQKALILMAILTVGLLVTVPAMAEETLPACTGDQVTGILVDYDPETETATIDTGEGLCTVVFNQEEDWDHPIINLLGSFFSTNESESLEEAVASNQVCVVQDAITLLWSVYETTEGEECPGQAATISGQNPDGSFSLVYTDEFEVQQEIMLTVDEETGTAFLEILAGLEVVWGLNPDGSYQDAGDQIAMYHDDGMGFGVLVKLFAMAMGSQEGCEDPAGCELDVAALVEAFEEGGMGALFKEYGKPEFLGVGHVRKEASSEEGSPGASGVCNAIANGGNPNANGHANADCGDDDPASAADEAPQNNKNKDKKPKENNGKKP